jgi:16S rRNA (cytosine967-C5)-methyltransferase
MWLGERWIKRMTVPELFRMGGWLNSPGRLYLRVNRLKTTPEELLLALRTAEIAADPVPGLNAVVIDGASQVDRLPGYDSGWFAVQDPSAMRAALRLAPQPGQRVWDVCAAPGGKTCHLAELMNDTGQVIATDVRPERLRLIDQNRERLGTSIVRTQLIGEDGTNLPDGPFDAILIDVPCSNTGVLGKRPEARWRITAAGITELNHVQERLLNAALDRLAPHGRLAYSTCSIEPEENSELVARVLSRRQGFQVMNEELFMPGSPADGGYQALLVRSDRKQ